MTAMIERVARALAERHGDKWDDIPDHKSHWTEKRGQFGGRFRDVNERFRCDYLDEAEAAIQAMLDYRGEVEEALDRVPGGWGRGAWLEGINAALGQTSRD